MLRLPPTAIVIVASEVMAYEERRQTRRYVFQLGKGTKSLSEVESQGPESNSPSSSANVKVDGSDTSGFRDAPAPSPGPSIPGDGGHDEPVEALNNLAQGRSTIFENPSLPVRLKPAQADGIVFPSEDNSSIPDTPPPRMEDLDVQAAANEASESNPHGMGLRTQRPCIRSSRHVSLDMTLSTPASLPRAPWLNTRSLQRQATQHIRAQGASPVTVSSGNSSRVREQPETPPRSSSLQAGNLESLPPSGASERSTSYRRRPPIVLLRSPGSSSHAALRASQDMGESNASLANAAQPSLLASLQLDGNHEFQIYNDEMPAAEQPQTPQNLPESRHRGRLGGAFTAPVTRIGMAQGYGAAAARAAIALVTPTTGSSGERARREPSPPGLNTPGYRGLYGGLENTDDAVLYEAGYRMTSRGSRHLEAESNQEERR